MFSLHPQRVLDKQDNIYIYKYGSIAQEFNACHFAHMIQLDHSAGGTPGSGERLQAKPLSAARRGPPWPGAAGDRERQEKMRF